MRRSRKGLGRGLGAFFGEEVVDEVSGKSSDGAEAQKELFVKVTEIEPNPDQPRKYFDEEQLNELAESIKQYGVLQPLLVQKKRDHYEIVAGERRWRAARIAGVEKVPVVVREFSPQEAMEIALIENLQREDLDPIEEAKAYERLMLEFRMTQGEIAKRVSKSRTVITNSVRLLYLNPEVQKMVSEKRITSGHARAILSLQDQDQQLELAKIVERDHLNVREVERAVKTFGKEKGRSGRRDQGKYRGEEFWCKCRVHGEDFGYGGALCFDDEGSGESEREDHRKNDWKSGSETFGNEGG